MKLIPCGVSAFETLRREGYYYVDKTRFLYLMAKSPEPFFLSRPRRFGKTLLVSALDAIHRGRRDLFEGLWIDGSDFDWTPRPVIRFSFGSVYPKSADALEGRLLEELESVAHSEGLSLRGGDPARAFQNLLQDMWNPVKRGVAVLIDEYDAPVLSRISSPELAEDIRDVMAAFYGALKDAGKWLGPVFITGVTRFTPTSLFSILNNLIDLTLEETYAAICGLTAEEFDAFLEDQSGEPEPDDPIGQYRSPAGFIATESLPPGATKDDLRSEILTRYDGYSWDGETRMLCPWSVFNSFKHCTFDDYWLQSGSPKFLRDLVSKDWGLHEVFKTGGYLNATTNAIDIGAMDPLALLFQTGYLTVDHIDKTSPESWKYHLRFPNQEVETFLFQLALNLESYIGLAHVHATAKAMLEPLIRLDAPGFEKAFEILISSIRLPSEPNEAYYRSLLLLALGVAGQRYDLASRFRGEIDGVHLRTADGSDFVIEMRYVSGKTSNQEALTDARFAQQMEAEAVKALGRIEKGRYALGFQGAVGEIYKMALVIGRYTTVLARFERASDWSLVLGRDGRYEVKVAPAESGAPGKPPGGR